MGVLPRQGSKVPRSLHVLPRGTAQVAARFLWEAVDGLVKMEGPSHPPLPPRPSPKASTVCCGSPSPWKPLPVPGPQRDRSKWGLWTEQCHGPLATRGHTPGGTRHMGCPHKLPLQKQPCGTGGELPETAAPGTGRAGPRSPARPGLLSVPALPSPLPCQVFVVELMGRRLLILLGFSICFTACCVLTVALALQVRRGT